MTTVLGSFLSILIGSMTSRGRDLRLMGQSELVVEILKLWPEAPGPDRETRLFISQIPKYLIRPDVIARYRVAS